MSKVTPSKDINPQSNKQTKKLGGPTTNNFPTCFKRPPFA